MFFPLKTSAHDGEIRYGSVGIILVCLGVHVLVWRDPALLPKLALVPGDFNPVNLITSQFTHAGWSHLVFNLWFFYIVGVTMEKYWGLGKFLGLYLASGICGELLFLLLNRTPGIPLVGASGAIAGMMGAFVVTHGDSKVTVFWLWGFRGRTFSVSARVYLGFWMAGQLLEALLSSASSGGSVAYSAHVAGFAFGLLAGKTVKGDVFYRKAYVADPAPTESRKDDWIA